MVATRVARLRRARDRHWARWWRPASPGSAALAIATILIAVTSPWAPSRLGNLTGKRVVVTGATNGVGLGTTRALAQAGAHVILAVRNTELGEQRAAQVGGSTSVVKLDLADLASVRAFPGLIDGDIDVLINNAGALTDRRTDTVDGFEMTLGTNLLGPFALTNLLLPRVRSQIINVGSDAHRFATLRLDDLHLREHKWTSLGAYNQSKLAVMLWGLELDRRLRAAGSPVVTQLTHPGWVASNLSHVSDSPLLSLAHRAIKTVADRLANDVDEGAAPTLYCISEPIPPGSYVGVDGRLGLRGGPVLIGRSVVACDYAAAARLVAFAEQETGTTLSVCHG
jgi:NAD(P)-dependent dehydrogenase (short-subunit alcohol dehydrogenase family)